MYWFDNVSLNYLFSQYWLSTYCAPFSLPADGDIEEVMIEINQQGIVWEDVNKNHADSYHYIPRSIFQNQKSRVCGRNLWCETWGGKYKAERGGCSTLLSV